MKTLVEVTQYLLPDGRKRKNIVCLLEDVQDQYDDMLQHRCRLEAEILITGEVSLTIYNVEDEQDIDMRIVQNGPATTQALIEMLKDRAWRTIRPE
jgi:hypothetical protein